MCKADYAGKLSDDEINLEKLEYLDKIYQEKGDTFNAVFDSKLTLLEALSRIGKASRTLLYVQAGKVQFTRDGIEEAPSMMFHAGNIVKDSWSIDYILPTSQTIDYAEVAYFDERTWSNKTIDVCLDENKKSKKTQMTMFGITNKQQAIKEAKYFLKNNKYRRRMVKFDTELEGAIPTIGSLIKLSYPMPKWGISGFVVSYSEEHGILELSEPVEMQDGQDYYVSLRNLQGEAVMSNG